VKRSRKILVVFQVVILCYFMSFFYSTSHASVNNTSESLFSQDESCFLFYFSNLIKTNTQPENLINQVNDNFRSFPKNHFDKSIASSIKQASTLPGIISKYIFFSRLCICRLEVADIIFPFHYHW